MPKAPNSIVGIDLGRYSLKAVTLRRKDGRCAVTHFGSYVPDEASLGPEFLAGNIKALLKTLGANPKNCVVSVSSPEALIRIIEQPETPTHILRDALRLNGMALLNQDVKSFVLDCDLIPSPAPEGGGVPRLKYLVGGLPRTEVEQVSNACSASGLAVRALQLSPVCIFNAFEFARPDVFANEAFFLVDIGHVSSTIIVGLKRELVLVRSFDFGGNAMVSSLCNMTGDGREAVLAALDQEDEVMVEYARVALNTMSREIASSVGFVEHHYEGAIGQIFVSGGPAKSKVFLKLMNEEVGMPCQAWSVFEKCEVDVEHSRREEFEHTALDFNVASGAAAQGLGIN